MSYYYTNSGGNQTGTNTGLSTQIIIKIDEQAVGAVQSFRATQNRATRNITEVGTDGNVEIVPNSATTFEIDIDRIYFDRKTITEAMGRAFINIQAQRYPFDIYVYDFQRVPPSEVTANTPAGDFDLPDAKASGSVIVTIYENCWFSSKTTTYQSSDYIITESARVTAEFCHTYIANSSSTSAVEELASENHALTDVERYVDANRPGSLDTRGPQTNETVFNPTP